MSQNETVRAVKSIGKQRSVTAQSPKREAVNPQRYKAAIAQGGMQVSGTLDASNLLHLQRTIGNRAVGQLLAIRQAAIQTKLTVGAADDPYEREADRMASQVMRMSSATDQPTQPASTPLLQRDANTSKNADLLGSFDAGQDVERQIAASSGGGNPLPANLRSDLEPKFGADFSNVRVHTGAQSDSLNRAVGAQAFTHRNHIYMAAGKYNPATGAGKQLLSHELTHVVQQAGASIRRQTKATEKSAIGSASNSTTPDALSADKRNKLMDKLKNKDQTKAAARKIAAEIENESEALLNQIANPVDRARVKAAIKNYVADSAPINTSARTSPNALSQNVIELDYALNTLRAQMHGGEKRRVTYRSITYDGGVNDIPYGQGANGQIINVGDYVGDLAFASSSEHRQFVLGKTQKNTPAALVRQAIYSYSGVPIAIHFPPGPGMSYDNANEKAIFDQNNNAKKGLAKAWAKAFGTPGAGQAEILFARDSVFRVTKIERKNNKNFVAVVLEEHRGPRPTMVKGAKFGSPI